MIDEERPAGRVRQPQHPAAEAGVTQVMVGQSLEGAAWTVASRLTGLVKSMTVAAVLGATYLGNTYQAINSLPNLVYYQLLAGSLFASLLVPPLVPYADSADAQGGRRLVGGFLGTLLVIGLVMSGLLLAVGRVILGLLRLGVANPATAASQTRVGWLLLLMFLPQILLYIVAGTGAAVMNAHGRFALAAAAPALESLGMIAVLAAAAALFGTATNIAHLSDGHLLLLGLGTTAAVALHAGCQWWGARSSGIAMVPRAGWRDPEVRRLIRRILPTLGYTGLAALQILSVLIVANRVSGGLVAFQLGLNFFYFPVAIVTWPIARALLPQLSRSHRAGEAERFGGELTRGVALASFITVPIAVAYAVLAYPLARAVAFGELGTPTGERLVALSLATLAVGVVGESWFILGTYAFYARHDARSPLRSMGVRVGVSLVVMLAAWVTRGPQVVVILGAALSLGSVAGALHMGFRLRMALPASRSSFLRPLVRTAGASLLMIGPAYLVTEAIGRLPHTALTEVAAISAAALVGLAVFLGVQRAWGAPEIAWLRSALSGLRPQTRREG